MLSAGLLETTDFRLASVKDLPRGVIRAPRLSVGARAA
jgi:hypothetical protein